MTTPYQAIRDKNLNALNSIHACNWITYFTLLLTFGLALGALICVAMLKPNLTEHFTNIRVALTSLSMFTTTACGSTALTINENCEDGNSCTLGFSVGPYPVCQHINLQDGTTCNSACLNSTLNQQCLSGVCTGTCLGQCSSTEEISPMDCPTLYLNNVTFNLPKVSFCFREVCQWLIVEVDILASSMLSECSGVDEFSTEICLNLLDPLSVNRSCITALYCSGSCVYRYICSNQQYPSSLPPALNVEELIANLSLGYPPGFNTTILLV